MAPIKMTRNYNPTMGRIWNIAEQEQLLHDAAESMMRKLYNLMSYDIQFDENPLKEQLIENIYGQLKRAAKKAIDCNGLSNAEYYNWTKF